MLKRLIKLKISLLYFIIKKVWSAFGYFDAGKQNRPYQVILYHDFEQSEKTAFQNQMQIIRSETQPLSVREIDSNQTSAYSVIVTFDDAIASLLETALPSLQEYDIPATIFVPTAYIGKTPKWDGWLNGDAGKSDKKVMTVEQLKSLPENIITLGSHTRTHQNLTHVDKTIACNEIKDSKRELESLVEKPIDYFAFPYGEYNDRVLRLSRESGYKRVFSALPSESNGFLEGRIDVSPHDWDIEFKLKILGYYRWMYTISLLKQETIRFLRRIIHR